MKVWKYECMKLLKYESMILCMTSCLFVVFTQLAGGSSLSWLFIDKLACRRGIIMLFQGIIAYYLLMKIFLTKAVMTGPQELSFVETFIKNI